MACAISTDRKWLRFDKEWKKVLAEYHVPYLHMNELVPRAKGPYAGWPNDRKDSFIKRCVWVFRTYVSAWCATTVDVGAFYKHISTDRHRRIRNPYFHVFQSCIFAVLAYCQQYEVKDKIGFMVDGGTVSATHAQSYFERCKEFKEAPNVDQLAVLLFGDDKKNHALQGADLLAYEVNKHAAGFERKSFKVLCELPHGIGNWKAEDLEKIADKFAPIV
jgi:hypothetical protein